MPTSTRGGESPETMNLSCVHARVPLPPSERGDEKVERGAGESTGHALEDVHAGEFVAVAVSG